MVRINSIKDGLVNPHMYFYRSELLFDWSVKVGKLIAIKSCDGLNFDLKERALHKICSNFSILAGP